MINELIKGILFVAVSDFREKVGRTIVATPNQKLGALVGGVHDYYCQGIYATNKWLEVADMATVELNNDSSSS